MLCLSNLLQQALRRHGEATALVFNGASVSYRQLDMQATAVAAYLRGAGVRRGDRVALHLRNAPEYVVADLAILKLCAVKVPLNELMAPDELSYCLDHSGAVALISHSSLPEPTVFPDGLSVRINVGERSAPRPGWNSWNDAVARRPEGFVPAAPGPDDIAMIAYTGGTTGRPKGVVHSQHRLALNLLAHVQCGEILPDEVMLLTTPLPHSAGYHLQACLLQGGKTILEPKFDPARLIDLAKRFDVTWTFAVPTMLYRMFDCLNQGADIPRSLRTVVYGAAPMSQTRLQEGIARLGHVFLQLYGQTECPNYITTLSKADHREEALQASCGRAVVMLDMRIRTPDDSIAGAGEVGEIEVSSPYQLIEYYRDSDQTRSTIVNGWLKTGDLGFCDEQGHLFLVDRAKDMIISGGMNVYCAEVETALQAYSAVGQAAVVGEPHPDWGEAVIAFVTTRAAVDEADIRVHLRTSLSGYKIPKRIIFIDDLPLTKYGKVDKKALRLLLSGSAVSS